MEVLSTGDDGAHNFGDNSGMMRSCDLSTFFYAPLSVLSYSIYELFSSLCTTEGDFVML